jgi:hypothetical protein
VDLRLPDKTHSWTHGSKGLSQDKRIGRKESAGG